VMVMAEFQRERAALWRQGTAQQWVEVIYLPLWVMVLQRSSQAAPWTAMAKKVGWKWQVPAALLWLSTVASVGT